MARRLGVRCAALLATSAGLIWAGAALQGRAAPVESRGKERELRVVLDCSKAPESKAWAEKSAELLRRWYPKAVEMLASEGFQPPREIKLVFRPGNDIGGTAGTTIFISTDWIKRHPDDFGMVVHEMVHVIQAYPRPEPGWLTEGIADYIRWFQFEPEARRPRPDPRRAKYTEGYQTTAAFLAWAVKTYDKDLVRKLNAAMRQSKYRDELFERATGKALPELWKEYVATLR